MAPDDETAGTGLVDDVQRHAAADELRSALSSTTRSPPMLPTWRTSASRPASATAMSMLSLCTCEPRLVSGVCQFVRQLAWDEALVWLDERFGYEELRMSALVPRGNRLYFVAFTDRGNVRRVISLRYAERPA